MVLDSATTRPEAMHCNVQICDKVSKITLLGFLLEQWQANLCLRL